MDTSIIYHRPRCFMLSKQNIPSSEVVIMDNKRTEQITRGFIFASTNNTEDECFERSLFAAEKSYGPVVIRIRKGDLLFLNNLDSNILHGVFQATSDGGFKIQADAWNGKYPYQVEIETLGNTITKANAKQVLNKLGVNRNTPLYRNKLISLLDFFLMQSSPIKAITADTSDRISQERENIRKETGKIDIESEIPPIESTTFWDFPRQSYGLTPKGNNKYAGVTPALIIYNLVWRYTDLGDLVVDPMCGSGTTIDVCREEKREVIGYDISSTRPDIIQNDARIIPLADNSVDLVFIDSPYGDNVTYSNHPDNIGHISSETDMFYDELEKVMKESYRILKDGKVLGWLIGDQWVKGRFTAVGFEIYNRLCKYFETVDIICVARRGQSSNTGIWHNRARRFNFYLRGFKYLLIMKKTKAKATNEKSRKIKWAYYDRRR